MHSFGNFFGFRNELVFYKSSNEVVVSMYHGDIIKDPEVISISRTGIVPDINAEADIKARQEGRAWTFIDRLLGTTEQAADIYTYIKTGEKPPEYTTLDGYGNKVEFGRLEKPKDWTGLTRPWGTVIVLSVYLFKKSGEV